MKNLILTFLLLLPFVSLAGKTYTLTVQIKSLDGQTPLKGIQVSFIDEDKKILFSALTDPSGKAVFPTCREKNVTVLCTDSTNTYLSRTYYFHNSGKTNKEELILMRYTPKLEKEFLQSKMAKVISDSTLQVEKDSCILDSTVPEYTGGREAMVQHLSNSIIYPSEAVEYGISGKVYLIFTIDHTGAISNIKIIKGIPDCPECDTEAALSVAYMPNWIPAKCNGEPITRLFTLPVSFILQ